ncbi:MAG: hypothetical protein PHW18_01650 [Sulfuricurvum sp.]|uniref:hypothetical protein n=1 Tax=Sulfuricurvum sp. TaxID=2025608 RepID=UPI00262354C9|nr:hypothetical protein [Sulfuricurvum sp.]MDD2828259.1 hypothetical protein [Sulfuricurvum sp.]MDD4949786.1 hypothetical protein [Sulfuricurvum sp.]
MKSAINHRTIYLILLSFVLLVGVLVFSFFFLIPKGKEYRTLRLENKKEEKMLIASREHYDSVHEKLLKLQESHKKTIKGFKSSFDPVKFTRHYKKEFQDLYVSEINMADQNGSFKIYEVNATAKISSPQTFYNFLDKVNKSDWIIGVDFPIHFEREGDLIKSSFTMKVHHLEEVKSDEDEGKVTPKKEH